MPETVRLVRHGPVLELHLDRPPANALDQPLLVALDDALRSAVRHGDRAIVLTGRPGMFSGGIDVPALLPLPRPAILAFWTAFFTVTRRLVDSPVPVIAAISGHSPAGGAVLALHCDHRVAVRGNFRMGLNEVAVGLPMPPAIMLALRETVGPRQAHRLASRAELLPIEEALACGLVDELAEPDQLLDRARALGAQFAALPPVALEKTRRVSRAALLAALDPVADAAVATDCWFSEETQAGMKALVERLARR
jgi:3,2-trans-enoyl-CoA isomerase